ncbi:MAG: fructosamine kinase family protein [Rhodospirillales bacterium]|nr:fructosamine kinase family protein [Rhodospirillales bacterium]
MNIGLETAIRDITGIPAERIAPLSGGCVGDVYRVDLANGQRLVAKTGQNGSGLAIEGMMLKSLARLSNLPVPDVLHAEDTLLLMQFIATAGGINGAAQEHAAELLADLHNVRGDAFGFDLDTLIGGLHQPNPETGRWRDFFAQHRLLYMGREALNAGRMSGGLMDRIEVLAGKLERWIEEPEFPSLLHGDMWTGNVLCNNGRIAGFIDPAVYFGDPEIELAFSTLFGTFGQAFFSRYNEFRPLRAGFFEERRDLYNLYPLLVHVRLFGGSYVGSVERTLSQFGC